MATFNGVAIADPSKKSLNFTTNEGFRPAVEGLNSDSRSSTDKNLKSSVLEGVTSDFEIEAHYLVALKDNQLPHITNGDQENWVGIIRDYESVKGFRIDETVTVPITSLLRTEIEDDRPFAIENEYKADVEESQLEADKYIRDTSINGGAWYNPRSVYKVPTFQQFDRWVYRIIRNPASRLSDPQDYADEKNYLYVDGFKSFQTRYYTNNPWVDSNTGRVILFEAPRTATRLA